MERLGDESADRESQRKRAHNHTRALALARTLGICAEITNKNLSPHPQTDGARSCSTLRASIFSRAPIRAHEHCRAQLCMTHLNLDARLRGSIASPVGALRTRRECGRQPSTPSPRERPYLSGNAATVVARRLWCCAFRRGALAAIRQIYGVATHVSQARQPAVGFSPLSLATL